MSSIFYQQLVWSLGEALALELVAASQRGDLHGINVSLNRRCSATLDVQHLNALYYEGGREKIASEPLLMLSCAPDKARVQTMGVFSTPFVLEDNTAFWGCPQDTAAFDTFAFFLYSRPTPKPVFFDLAPWAAFRPSVGTLQKPL